MWKSENVDIFRRRVAAHGRQIESGASNTGFYSGGARHFGSTLYGIAGRFLFVGRRLGTPLSDVENAHKRVLAKSGLAFVIYDFRHTFATRFAEATGGDVVALAAILGHANLRTVMRYVHGSREHMKNQMQRFVEAENNGSNPCLMRAPKTAILGEQAQIIKLI